jgi:hypothetical protein
LLFVVIIFVAIAANPALILLSCFVVYVLSGPVYCLLRWIR